jgi:hypothetical protein
VAFDVSRHVDRLDIFTISRGEGGAGENFDNGARFLTARGHLLLHPENRILCQSRLGPVIQIPGIKPSIRSHLGWKKSSRRLKSFVCLT